VVLWRISHHDSLTGEGGLRSAGRWHTIGRPLVYCTQSPAAALLEMLVRLERTMDAVVRYRLIRIEAPDNVPIEALGAAELQADWIANRSSTQTIGDAWLARAPSALLLVPSAVVPETANVLMNPAHPAARRIRLIAASEHQLDSRLLR
jgi:RES domain-containing protein